MNRNQTTTEGNSGSQQRNPRRNDLGVRRQERKLSLKQVALITGIARRTLEDYERGRIMPSLIAAFKLQILYRGQLASFYQPLYWELTEEIRAAEERIQRKRGMQ